jgi:cytochrome c553
MLCRIVPGLIGRAVFVGMLLLGAVGSLAAEPTAEGIAFFESKIRPVLVAKCYQCHSAEAQSAGRLKAELLLDTRDGMLKGGESGPAIVPGDKKKSLLLDAIAHQGLEMPPEGKLPENVIADFTTWFEMGAPDPRTGPAAAVESRKIDVAAGRNHWSYRRLSSVALPPVKDAAWVRNDIDRFIRGRQEATGVVPNSEAGKETLLRRVTFDLVGLPPTPEEQQAFLADGSPDAYEQVVDRLLASPQFGERWARHWLDVVRYGESGGYEFDNERKAAFQYRDFVIRAFNADMPYDEFLRLQVAGDLLRPDDYQAVAATGLLVAGPYPNQVTAKTIEPIRYDQLDDMATTLGAAALGMTIGCARCHDHKYDAIAQRDYYALLSSLRNAVQAETQIDSDPAATARALEAWGKERAPLAAAVDRVRRETFPGALMGLRSAVAARSPGQWLALHPRDAKGKKATLAIGGDGVVTATGKLEGDDSYRVVFQTRGRELSALRLEALSGTAAPRTGPGTGKDGAFRLSRIVVTAKPLVPAKDRQPLTPKLVAVAATAAAEGGGIAGALDQDPATGWSVGGESGRDHAAVVGFEQPVGFEGGTELAVELFFEAGQHGLGRFRVSAGAFQGDPPIAGSAVSQAADEVVALAAAAEAVGKRAEADDATWQALVPWYRLTDAKVDESFAALEKVDARKPKPALVAVYRAVNGSWVIPPNNQGVKGGSSDVFLLARGEVGRKQGKIDPGFIRATVFSDESEQRLFAGSTGSGAGTGPRDSRLSLADCLTDMEQGAGPLVARVIVNRLWHHHFGRGIVSTPNDLGTQGDRPTHPELLEWLAGRLVKDGWSLKKIHRLIVTSATYRQAGIVTEANRKADPDNLLLWHRLPLRLEAEAIRDALLAVSGKLQPVPYGPSVADVNQPRRSIYLRVKRSEPIAFLRLFDQPEPVQSVGSRGVATVPTQSLTLMNSPFIRAAAEGLAQRARAAAGSGSAEQLLDQVTTIALGRRSSTAEREELLPFLAAREQQAGGDAGKRAAALADVCQIVLCFSEFFYVD